MNTITHIPLEKDTGVELIIWDGGDPNGVLKAAQGSECYDRTGPGVYQNVDGLTTWTQLVSGGGIKAGHVNVRLYNGGSALPTDAYVGIIVMPRCEITGMWALIADNLNGGTNAVALKVYKIHPHNLTFNPDLTLAIQIGTFPYSSNYGNVVDIANWSDTTLEENDVLLVMTDGGQTAEDVTVTFFYDLLEVSP